MAATHEDILSRIVAVESRLSVEVAGVAKGLEDHRDDMSKVEAFLFGRNGSPGLAELVRQHERWIAGQRKLLFVIVPAFLLGVGAVVWQTVVLVLQARVDG